ncbi:MAG: hypothetical protein EBR82_09675 [Caulobacteraceae bacterium]|nr:hypothetical protein [Caulobacteraceae bacterium]
MTDKNAQQALEALKAEIERLDARRTEHEQGDHGVYYEYASGIADALNGIRPFVAALESAAPSAAEPVRRYLLARVDPETGSLAGAFSTDAVTIDSALRAIEYVAQNDHPDRVGVAKSMLSAPPAPPATSAEAIDDALAEHDVALNNEQRAGVHAAIRSLSVAPTVMDEMGEREGPAVASSACPICGVDTPHGHAGGQVVEWLRAQAGRFMPNTPMVIEIGTLDQQIAARAKRNAQESQDELNRYAVNEAYASGCATLSAVQPEPETSAEKAVMRLTAIRTESGEGMVYKYQRLRDMPEGAHDLFAAQADAPVAEPVAPSWTSQEIIEACDAAGVDDRTFRRLMAAFKTVDKRSHDYQATDHDVEIDQALFERDEREEVINSILDEVLGLDRQEWSSAYGFADAIEDVKTRMWALTRPPAPEEGKDAQIRRLTAFLHEAQELLDRRPAVNQGLFEAYQKWTGEVYALDWLNGIDAALPQGGGA